MASMARLLVLGACVIGTPWLAVWSHVREFEKNISRDDLGGEVSDEGVLNNLPDGMPVELAQSANLLLPFLESSPADPPRTVKVQPLRQLQTRLQTRLQALGARELTVVDQGDNGFVASVQMALPNSPALRKVFTQRAPTAAASMVGLVAQVDAWHAEIAEARDRRRR